MKKIWAGCAAAVALAGIGGVAHAAPTGTAVTTQAGTVTGKSASGATTFTGTFNESVYNDSSSNGLDFVFQFTNNSTSSNPVTNIQVSSFTGFSPVASNSTASVAGGPSGGVAPNSSTVSGGVATFDFSQLPGGGLLAGATSDNLIVSTTATSYSNLGSFAVQGGGGNGTSLDVQGAISAAPEPGAWALMLGGVGMLGLMLRGRLARRRDDEMSHLTAA